MAAAVVMCFTIPFFGRLSDRIGRTRVYFWGSLITGARRVPGFWLMTHSGGNVLLIWLAIIIPFGILYASVYGPEAALFCDLFDAKVRYTGISFVYQFSGIFASGITPIVATALLKSGGGQPWQIACTCCSRASSRRSRPRSSAGPPPDRRCGKRWPERRWFDQPARRSVGPRASATARPGAPSGGGPRFTSGPSRARAFARPSASAGRTGRRRRR